MKEDLQIALMDADGDMEEVPTSLHEVVRAANLIDTDLTEVREALHRNHELKSL